MTSSIPLTGTPSIASAINRHILTVTPDTSVADVIHKMSVTESASCQLSGDQPSGTKRASCVIVTNQDSVVGICTERDIVRLTATKLQLMTPLANIPVSRIMTSPVKTMEESAFQDIFAVLFLFRRYRIRHLPIVDDEQKLLGIVTPASIREVLRPANLLKMRRVADVMSQGVIQSPTTAPVIALAKQMAQHSVSCVVIVDRSADETDETDVCRPVGIVTERDIVQFQALGLSLQNVTAQAVMSTPLFLLDPKDSLWAAHETMQARRVRRLVVSWNWGQGLGIVTQTSLLRVFDPIEMCGVIDSLQQTVERMKVEDVKPEAQEQSLEEMVEGVVSAIAAISRQPQMSSTQVQQLQRAIALVEGASLSSDA
ncbi:MAG: CBS domain-containing protein [Phormidesmis sp.]